MRLEMIFLGSAGCQPAVAGSFAGNTSRSEPAFGRKVCPGKLPEPADWQPALPRGREARRAVLSTSPMRLEQNINEGSFGFQIAPLIDVVFVIMLFFGFTSRVRKNLKQLS
jgi:hypothetical protein